MASSSCCSASATQALCSQLKLHCRVSSPARQIIPCPTKLPFAAPTCPLLSSRTFTSKSHPPLNPRPPRCTSAPVLDNPTTVEASDDPPNPEEAKEQVFAVVMIGSRQYIVFPGRYIYTQRLKGATPNDKIVLNKVLLVGTKTSTYIGKPVVPNAVVHAVVQEQGLDPKVTVFKYKKKKKYRRNIGHRQPNTRIMITGITGYQDSPVVTLDSL